MARKKPFRPDLGLLKEAQLGSLKARDGFFILNQPLVVYVANRFKRPGIEFDDLVQEGGIALLKCMQTFDFSRNLQFSTYALPSIFRSVQNYVKLETLIPTERNFHDSAMRWWREKSRLKRELMREPSDEMVNASLNWPKKKIKNIHLHGHMVNYNPSSLDEVVKRNENQGNNDLKLSDVVSDGKESKLDRMIREETNRLIQESVNKLKHKWQSVVVIRHGLDDGENKTLKEVAKMFGLSRERIRQIESDAFRELRRGLK